MRSGRSCRRNEDQGVGRRQAAPHSTSHLVTRSSGERGEPLAEALPMGSRLLLVVLALALSGCVSVKVRAVGPGPFAHRLEQDGIDGRRVRDARCRVGSEGWSYVCTYSRGSNRKMMAFRVDLVDDMVARSEEREAPLHGFARRAASICARRNAALRGFSRAKNRRQAIANVDRALAAERAAVGQLERLLPPSSRAADFAKLIEAEHTLVNMTQQGRAAMARGDDNALRRATSIAEAEGNLIAYEARRLGLRACAPS